MHSPHIEKYLKTYAETETQLLETLIHQDNIPVCDNAIVVPCYDEDPEFFYRLVRLCANNKRKVLLILVINRPDTSDICQNNQNLLTCVKKESSILLHNHYISGYLTNNLLTVLVDRSEAGPLIPAKQGVGLARKIGGDIAALCYLRGKLRSPWIYSTDADAHLPDNYFIESLSEKNSAYTLGFSHINNHSNIALATQTYEKALHYYVAGLKWSNSSYAFNTIGSAIIVNLYDYCKVRGFPKRSGAEDFYLLNKLRKIGTIEDEKDIVIKLESRTSHRIPFGTGPAVEKILAQTSNNEPYTYFHPNCFINLKLWLDHQSQLFSLLKESNNLGDALSLININAQIIDTLLTIGFEKFYSHALSQVQTVEDFEKHFLFWFDGFKTLKFIRHQQEKFYPPLPLEQAIEIAPFDITQGNYA